MVKLAVPLSVLTLAGLGACSTPPQTGGPANPNPVIVTQVHPYTAGNGVVQQVMPAPAGATASSSSQPMQRLEIRMDNGVVQYVDTPTPGFTKGTRVTLTEDRLIRRM